MFDSSQKPDGCVVRISRSAYPSASPLQSSSVSRHAASLIEYLISHVLDGPDRRWRGRFSLVVTRSHPVHTKAERRGRGTPLYSPPRTAVDPDDRTHRRLSFSSWLASDLAPGNPRRFRQTLQTKWISTSSAASDPSAVGGQGGRGLQRVSCRI